MRRQISAQVDRRVQRALEGLRVMLEMVTTVMVSHEQLALMINSVCDLHWHVIVVELHVLVKAID